MAARLEHANLSVRDVDGAIRFLLTAFPEFEVRHEGLNANGRRWVHVGDNNSYIALMQATQEPQSPGSPYDGTPRVNHLAYEVDDVAAIEKRLAAAGYQDTTVPNAHPYRKRIYFNDAEGNEWEFVEYLSDDPALRHDYQLPDA